LLPLVLHPIGRAAIGLVIVAGLVALLAGRPNVPQASDNPIVEVLAMIVLGLAATFCHELGHAVALVHYDRTPRRAGFGFYWGAVSFFVDSTPALTLPRRARVVQALAGLMVDTVTTALFAIAAQLTSSTLWAIVFWRLAILSIVDMLINLAPILQVDGHWALADWLDEPDLAVRARAALGAALRGRVQPGQRWLAMYGAISLVAGMGLLAVLINVFWANAGALVVNLFSGGVAEIALGIYYVAPVTLGIVFSVIGLLMETVIPMSRHP
jgi:putative peptide zinc metalloprotease protein